MSEPRRRQYVLYPTDEVGSPVQVAVERIEAAEDLALISRREQGLLIEGAAGAVKSLTRDLDGWRAELSGMAKAVG